MSKETLFTKAKMVECVTLACPVEMEDAQRAVRAGWAYVSAGKPEQAAKRIFSSLPPSLAPNAVHVKRLVKISQAFSDMDLVALADALYWEGDSTPVPPPTPAVPTKKAQAAQRKRKRQGEKRVILALLRDTPEYKSIMENFKHQVEKAYWLGYLEGQKEAKDDGDS